MRVLLVDPGSVGSRDWGDPQTTKLALLCLHSYLRAHAPELSVEICDFELELEQPDDDSGFARYRSALRQRLTELDFDLLGISCWSSLKYRAAVAVAEIARELRPAATIVVGGYHPSAVPDDFAYRDSPFDHIVTGEGEAELLRLLGEGESADAGSYPLRWDEYPLYDAAETQFPILFSRGCPYGCSFCMEPYTKGRSWRPLPIAESLQRLDDLLAHRPGARFIAVQDALFGVKASWRDALLQALVERDFTKLLWAETRSDIWTSESLALTGRLNFILDFGVESASPEMISIMNKARSPERYLQRTAETLRAAGAAGVASFVYLITHHPGERLRHVQETLAFFRELLQSGDTFGIAAISPQRFMYFPGSKLDRSDEYQQRFGTVVTSPQWWKHASGPLQVAATGVTDRVVTDDERAEIDALWKSGVAELNQLAAESCGVQAQLKVHVMRSLARQAKHRQ